MAGKFKAVKQNINHETRWVMVDEETGEVVDNANGYGYRSAVNAHAAWSWKQKPPKQKRKTIAERQAFENWIKKHPHFEEVVIDVMFRACKEGTIDELCVKDIYDILEELNLLESLPFDRTRFARYVLKN